MMSAEGSDRGTSAYIHSLCEYRSAVCNLAEMNEIDSDTKLFKASSSSPGPKSPTSIFLSLV